METLRAAKRFLTRYALDILRTAVGLVFLVFGGLKLNPGSSPAEQIAIETVEKLTFGVIHGNAALILTAEMEIFIGLTLTFKWAVKAGLVALGFALIGILSPLFLFPGQLFHGGVTLLAQYVFKDIVIAAAAVVLGMHALGARFLSDEELAQERAAARHEAELEALEQRRIEMEAARARLAPKIVTHTYSVRSRNNTPAR